MEKAYLILMLTLSSSVSGASCFSRCPPGYFKVCLYFSLCLSPSLPLSLSLSIPSLSPSPSLSLSLSLFLPLPSLSLYIWFLLD